MRDEGEAGLASSAEDLQAAIVGDYLGLDTKMEWVVAVVLGAQPVQTWLEREELVWLKSWCWCLGLCGRVGGSAACSHWGRTDSLAWWKFRS